MSELNIKLGTLLKIERETQKITIEDLSERLKISISNLQSIENGTTDGLPSDLYFSLFAKSYAEALGIDYTRTVEAIKVDIAEANDVSAKSKNNNKKQNSDESEDEQKPFSTTSIIIATIVAISLLYFGANKFLFNSDSPDTATATTEEILAEKKSQEAIEKDEAYANYDWDNKSYDKPSKIVLTMTPRAESWSAVFADGDTAIYRTLRVGRTYTAEADYRMTVSVGKPLSVTVKLNGQEVDLRDKDTRRITRVRINQMDIYEYLQKDTDSKTTVTAPQASTAVQAVATTIDSVSNENNETN